MVLASTPPAWRLWKARDKILDLDHTAHGQVHPGRGRTGAPGCYSSQQLFEVGIVTLNEEPEAQRGTEPVKVTQPVKVKAKNKNQVLLPAP